MPTCIRCGSHAINHHHHGRDGSRPDLCDVCYWRAKAEELQAAPKSNAGEAFAEASECALVSIRNLLLRVAHAQKEAPSCPDWVLREMLAIADTAHNLPQLAIEPERFSPDMLASFAHSYRHRYGAGLSPRSPAIGYTHLFWDRVDRLVGADLGDWIRAEEGDFQ